MEITWLGTASFVIETQKGRVLFDPFVQLLGGAHPNTIDDFLDEDVIFITHCHFDHLHFVPEILERSEATVFCASVPARMLESLTDETDRIAELTVGQTVPIGDMLITAYPGKHIFFDKHYLGDTLSPRRMVKYARNLPFLFYANKKYQEEGQTLAYEICAEGKRILLLGSMNVDEQADYPEDIDLLILPYQGNNDLVREADKVIGRLQPKNVLLSHFDNAFPPISRNVDLSGLKKLVQEKYPQMKVVKPTRGKKIQF